MSFSLGNFVVCILILAIIYLVVEGVIWMWFSGPPPAPSWPRAPYIVRIIFSILLILCILHGLGYVSMPITLR